MFPNRCNKYDFPNKCLLLKKERKKESTFGKLFCLVQKAIFFKEFQKRKQANRPSSLVN